MRRWSLLDFLAGLLVLTMYIVNAAGFIDTRTHSAFGCGREWPLCNGSLIPAKWGLHTIIEFAHRGLVGVVTVLFLIIAIWAWWKYGHWIEIRVAILLGAGFIVLESGLGALGVLYPDPPALLASHFGIALIAFDAVTLLSVVLFQIRRRLSQLAAAGKVDVGKFRRRRVPVLFSLRDELPTNSVRRLVIFLAVYVYLAMYVGAYVSATDAGAYFRGWPFPTETYAEAHVYYLIDLLHRSVALGLVILSIWLLVVTRRMREQRSDLYKGAWTLVALVFAQALSGGYLIWSHLSTTAFLIHVSIISVLFGTLGYLVLQVSPGVKKIKGATT